jgi:hypothetical protein
VWSWRLADFATVAGVVYPLMMRELFEKVGFAWAVRILAFVMLGGLSVSLTILRPHTNARKERALLKSGLLCDAPYTIFIVCRSSFFRSLKNH